MDFGKAIELGGNRTCGVQLFVFEGTKAPRLFDVLKETNEFGFELGVGSLLRTL